jgi:hypothetical protein
MKKHFGICLIFALLLSCSFCRGQEKYSTLIQQAFQLYQNKAYLESARKYSEAFALPDSRLVTTDRYNAGCSWALAARPDSAFVQLFTAVRKGNYQNLNHIAADEDLQSLHADKRWKELIALVEINKARGEANLDKPLVAILDTIYREDQSYRQQLDAIEKKFGLQSTELQAHWKLIGSKDSVNLLQVKKILDERGWLGADVVGNQGNAALFLVIQHADIATQQHYLSMMREAVKTGKANPASLALLEDRVALRTGRRQIYGSQIARDQKTGEYYVMSLDDPEHVDQRRSEAGLGSMQDYLSNWKLTWNPEAYKKMLPELDMRAGIKK